MGWFWGMAALVFPLAGWIVYLVVRPPESMADARERDLEIRAKEASLARDYETCPACFKPVEKDFLICPHCMKKLRKPCVECGKALKLNWGVCPFCKTKQ
jgi:RNA polymerase subunit RPABC4/transcription elongation factor Spt4